LPTKKKKKEKKGEVLASPTSRATSCASPRMMENKKGKEQEGRVKLGILPLFWIGSIAPARGGGRGGEKKRRGKIGEPT